MIRENQRLLNWLNVFSDGVIVFLSLPAAFWIRFFVLPGANSSPSPSPFSIKTPGFQASWSNPLSPV